MKIIIVPILDISYYLPEFSGFDKNLLFNNINNLKKIDYNISLDIDKILKNSEQNKNNDKINNNNEKKILEENYYRKIYEKSNPDLAKDLLKISNHIDFGKNEEFFFIENNKEKKLKQKKYFLCCLVKPSHHIKGVFFINENDRC